MKHSGIAQTVGGGVDGTFAPRATRGDGFREPQIFAAKRALVRDRRGEVERLTGALERVAVGHVGLEAEGRAFA